MNEQNNSILNDEQDKNLIESENKIKVEEGLEPIAPEYKKDNKTKVKNTTLYIAKISALAAIAFVLMFIQFPIFPAFPFLEIDFSNVMSLIGGFVLGPLAAFIIECIKVICMLLVKGTATGYVGELSNLIVSLAFVLPPTIIYHYRKTFKTAIISLVIGLLFGCTVACLSNYFLVFPLYLNGFGEGILQGQTLGHVILAVVLPFNLIKQTINIILTLLLYKKVGHLLRRF